MNNSKNEGGGGRESERSPQHINSLLEQQLLAGGNNLNGEGPDGDRKKVFCI
jgi:hypothetical protein